jgi:hypothetical protein
MQFWQRRVYDFNASVIMRWARSTRSKIESE